MIRLKTIAVWLWLAVPLGILIGSQLSDKSSDLEWRRNLVVSMPENEAALLGLVDALLVARRDVEALEHAKQAVAVHPDSERGHRTLFALYGRMGRHDDAMIEFEQLVRIEKLIALDLVGAGVIVQAKHPQQAIDYFTQALDLDPTNVEANINLAVGLIEARQLDAARRHLERALASSPGNIAALVNLGFLEQRAGRPYKALAQFEAVLQHEPRHALALEMTNEIRNRTGRAP